MPFQTIALAFVLSILVLAYLVRIAEAPVNAQELYFWNELWLVVVTAASVGYGDIYPLTHLGRFLCFLAMVLGALLVAVLTVTISSKLSLNAGESRLMQFLQRSAAPPPLGPGLPATGPRYSACMSDAGSDAAAPTARDFGRPPSPKPACGCCPRRPVAARAASAGRSCAVLSRTEVLPRRGFKGQRPARLVPRVAARVATRRSLGRRRLSRGPGRSGLLGSRAFRLQRGRPVSSTAARAWGGWRLARARG